MASPAKVALVALAVSFVIPALFVLVNPGEAPVRWLLLAVPVDLVLAIGISGLGSPLLDFVGGAVRTLEGPIRIVERCDSHAAPAYAYVIGGEQIAVDPQACGALLPGVSYRVWVLPRSGDLVGIEAVDVLQGG